jgi:hypothetical protein
MDEMDHQAKYQSATTDPRREQELRIQALGAALSRRDWHATEKAYEAIRDQFDCHGVAQAEQEPAPNIVERLRNMGLDEREMFRVGTRSWMLEAADRIEALEAALRGMYNFCASNNDVRLDSRLMRHAREALAVYSQDRGSK